MLKFILIEVTILFIAYLYFIVRCMKKHARAILCINCAVLVLLFLAPGLFYKLYGGNDNNNEVLQDYIVNVAEHSNGSIEFEKMEDIDNFFTLSYISDYILNNSDLELDVSIRTEEELDKFVKELEFDDDCSDYVSCYLKYTTYCMAEYSLDEKSEDYWHLKYITHDKALSYNYGVLVKYKEQGFLIKYYSTIEGVCAIASMFLVFYYLVVTFIFALQTGGNKGDL